MKHYLIICIATAMLMMGGCSSRLAYNNLDWLAYWYITDYITLNDEQKQSLQQELAIIQTWHRQTELPLYRSSLLKLKTAAINSQPLDSQLWLETIADSRASWIRLRERTIQSITQLLPTLTPEQIEELFLNLAEKNQHDRDSIPDAPEERFEQRHDQLSELLEEFMGHLTKQQDMVVQLYIGSSFDTRPDYLISSANMQQDIKLKILGYLANASEQKLAAITQALNSPEEYRPPQYQSYLKENRLQIAAMLAEVSETATARQKDHFLEQVQEWIDLIDSLLEDTKMPAVVFPQQIIGTRQAESH